MLYYSEIYKIFGTRPEENDSLREGMTDEMFLKELMKEVTLEDLEKNVVCFANDAFYIRDDGRRANRIFRIFQKYYFVGMKEVSDTIKMENDYIQEFEKEEEPKDKSKYNMQAWRDFDKFPLQMFTKFRKESTSTDDVLDKIIEKGIDYLDDIDKDILENKKPS
jgi:hypothetical protein